MYLTPHFTLKEMTASERADENGIDNSLSATDPADAEFIRNLTLVAELVLEPARKHYGVPIIPSSGYRCPVLNVIVNGSPTSDHMQGMAVDFEVRGISNIDLAYWLVENTPSFDQIILERYKASNPSAGWVHVSVSSHSSRKDVRTMGKEISGPGLPTRAEAAIPVTEGECNETHNQD